MNFYICKQQNNDYKEVAKAWILAPLEYKAYAVVTAKKQLIWIKQSSLWKMLFNFSTKFSSTFL